MEPKKDSINVMVNSESLDLLYTELLYEPITEYRMSQKRGISISVTRKKLSCVKSPETLYGASFKRCFRNRVMNIHTMTDAIISLRINKLICKGLEWCML